MTEREGTMMHFLYRQLLVSIKPVTTRLEGQTGIITGSNTGIGFEAARQALSLGLSHLILAVRTEKSGEAARISLQETAPNAKIDVWTLDMSSYSSIIQFARRTESLPRIDFVILNAGVFKSKFELSPEGHEMAFQVNWLSTALLAILLLPILKTKEGNKRLTIISSDTHEMPQADLATKYGKSENIFAAMDDSKTFDPVSNYYNSKLLEVLFVRSLVARISDAVTVNLANPGLTKGSDMHRDTEGGIKVFMATFKGLVGRTKEVAARNYLLAAVGVGKESHGLYISEGKIARSSYLENKDKAKDIADKVWDELMAELSKVAPIEEILKQI